LGLPDKPKVPEIDRLLHKERLDGKAKRRHAADIGMLPDGAVIEIDGKAAAVSGARLLVWEPAGYASALPRPESGAVVLLTPPAIVAALKAGFRPLWHPSAETAPAR
jgi:hypothetical protein